MLLERSGWASVAVLVSVGAVAGCGAADADPPGSDEETAEQTQALPPPPPTLVSPTGAGVSNNPTYVWNAVAGSTGYQLWVDDGSGNRFKNLPVTAAAAGCASGPPAQCSHTPPTVLVDGPGGKWWARSSNADGPGAWSLPLTFTVGSTPPPTQAPGLVTILTPAASSNVSTTPTYTWNAITGPGAAESYALWVDDAVTKGKVKINYTPFQANCPSGGVCSVTPAVTMAMGAAKVWIEARNTIGNSGWGSPRKFIAGFPPGVPALTNPTGLTVDTTPTYTWNSVAGATEYRLHVDALGAPAIISQVYTAAQAGCDTDTTCSVTPATVLPVGAAKFFVLARNVVGSGNWSPARNFIVDNVDECAQNTDNCDAAATCTNTAGSFTCACPAGQIGNGTACSCDLSGVFAVREQLNVVWDPVLFGPFTILDGGSATTSAWYIRQHNVSNGTLEVATTPCGATSPDICSSQFAEEAFSQFVPDNIWQIPSMPVGLSSMPLTDPDPGDPFVGPLQVAVGGISLTDPFGAWPAAHNSPGISWVDHDNDGNPGMTQFLKSTGTSPTCNLPYANLFDPINLFGPRIDRVYVGSRALSNHSGSITSCNQIDGTVAGPSNGFPQVNGHVRGCRHVGGAACSTATFEELDTQGQTVSQRITGSSFRMVRVAANITCAQVRAMSF